MPRRFPAFARKALTASTVAFLLMFLPSQLAASEKGSQASPLAWFSSLWSDLAAWFAELGTDNGCAADPQGGCGSQPEAPAELDTDNGVLVDPHGG